MRRILYSILCMILLISINGCGGSSSDDGGVTSSAQQQANSVTELAANDIAGITVKKNMSYDITLSATAPAGSTLTYVIDTPPQHGSLTPPPSGPLYTYTPATDYIGSDNFTYHVNNGTNNSNNATVYLTVVNASPNDPNGTSTISATGGQGIYHDGANGGGLWIYSFRNLSLTLQGTIDTTFDAPVVDELDLGTNPAVIVSNTVIKVLDYEPEYGVPYMIHDDPHLYISNEDGYLGNYDAIEQAQEIATGLYVIQDVTVEVEANNPEFIPQYDNQKLAEQYAEKPEYLTQLVFSNNIIVYGSIKTKPVPPDKWEIYGSNSHGSLGLSTNGQILVAPGGSIDCSGDTSSDTGAVLPMNGGNGGKLWLQAEGTIALKGLLDTSGGNGTTWGGWGGCINVCSTGVNTGYSDDKARIFNLGQILAKGGSGAGGGFGGAVFLHNVGDDIYCSGDISTQGGASVRGDAGRGGFMMIFAGLEGITGNLIMSGNLNTSGGDSADRGDGGAAGWIWLMAFSGDMTLAGTITANGGAASYPQGCGGPGGNIWINACGLSNETSVDSYDVVSTGLIQVGSIIAANGGLGNYDGAPGGEIVIGTNPEEYQPAWSHDVQLIGYQWINLNGGAGSYDGGYGGYLYFELLQYDGSYLAYALLNEVPVQAVGGMGTSGYGGSGGYCWMGNYTYAGPTTNSVAINISDGDGAYGVDQDGSPYGQYFGLFADGAVTNSGSVMALGGAALLDLVGDAGGEIDFESRAGDATNTAEVRGTGGAAGGNGGSFWLLAQGHAANSGSLYFEGGSGGGKGGWVEMDCGNRDTANTAALITVYGIPIGTIKIDYKDVTPSDGTLP